MIIHGYFTEGYYPWAELFVKSLKKSNGEQHQLILSSRNLDDKRISKLEKIYKGVEIINKYLNYEKLAKRGNVPLSTLMKFKKETETVKINKKNKVWKLLISAEDRIKEIREVARSLNHGDLMLNLDIDSYIRKPLDPWIDIISQNDFTTIWRIEKQIRKHGYVKKHNRAMVACFQGYNINEKSLKLLNRWVHYIDRISPPKRLAGFGQTTLYEAYLELKDELKWGDIPKDSFSLTASIDRCILWGANKGSKTENLERCRRDFEKME